MQEESTDSSLDHTRCVDAFHWFQMNFNSWWFPFFAIHSKFICNAKCNQIMTMPIRQKMILIHFVSRKFFIVNENDSTQFNWKSTASRDYDPNDLLFHENNSQVDKNILATPLKLISCACNFCAAEFLTKFDNDKWCPCEANCFSSAFLSHPFAIEIMIIVDVLWWMHSKEIIYGFAHHMLCHFQYNSLFKWNTFF